MNKEINVGDNIYEIHSYRNVLYINKSVIKKVTPKERIICNFLPFNGVKIKSLNQFNYSYRSWDERGNYLNMFQCFSLESDLTKNIELFKRKYFKVAGTELNEVIFNYE